MILEKKEDKNRFLEIFIKNLLSLGVRSGGLLMVHPALKPFGYVPGGSSTIIEGLLLTLGKNGTLLMPALSWENVTRRKPIFNLYKTPSCVGIIAETFRNYAGVSRSLHPTHSVCSFGVLSEELIGKHHLDHTPCGPNSPYHNLPKYHGQILMLACGLTYNTSMHAIEELIEPPYLFGEPINYTLIDSNNNSYQKVYIPHNFYGWKQRYDRLEKVLRSPDLISNTVVGTSSHLIEATSLWKTVISTLSKDELFFVDRTN